MNRPNWNERGPELLEALEIVRVWLNVPPGQVFTVNPDYISQDGITLRDAVEIADEAIARAKGLTEGS